MGELVQKNPPFTRIPFGIEIVPPGIVTASASLCFGVTCRELQQVRMPLPSLAALLAAPAPVRSLGVFS